MIVDHDVRPKCECHGLPMHKHGFRRNDIQSWRCQIRSNELSKQKAQNSPELIRARHLKYKFGLTPQDYEKLFKEQDGVCAICAQAESSKRKTEDEIKNLAVDHNHLTGAVRGLLCQGCNIALGYMDDDVERLRNAINYLERH